MISFFTKKAAIKEDQFLSIIIETIQERENKLTDQINLFTRKEEQRIDTLISGFGDLEKELTNLSSVVTANHSSALSSINSNKHELLRDISDTYATKTDLSNGLNSIRNAAKIVWTVVAAIGAAAAWLSSQNII